ncbi:MAG: MarR family transcriptional regulator [Pseudomonadota bacterium]|nr:MarR family transcriptional regulator [Pseudomonadota bacterium]MEC8807378.1 MarR family transcriptional regulator [Pseudomonadota bacterium]
MDPSDSYVLERQVGFVMRRAVQRHIAIFSALVPEMTPTQFAALAKLCELGQASQNELGRLTSMDVATIKGVVDRLRSRDLISSAPLESDRRRLMLAPTRKGRALYRKYAAQAAEVTRQTLAPLDADEQRQLMTLLERLI